MNIDKITAYYNKFNEDKRLTTRHGMVEFLTAMTYIHKYLNDDTKILDIGAGTGAYSVPLYQEGYDVTAVELVKHNLRRIQSKAPHLKAYQGNAIDLSRFEDSTFDLVLLFGPMYHLMSFEEKCQALSEAKRILKDGGHIMISYCMNEYAIIQHGFRDGFIKQSVEHHHVDQNYHVLPKGNELYSYVRIEDINHLKDALQLKRKKMIAQDGFAEYMKKEINHMDDDSFTYFMEYHYSTCERPELLGFSRHVLDILSK